MTTSQAPRRTPPPHGPLPRLTAWEWILTTATGLMIGYLALNYVAALWVHATLAALVSGVLVALLLALLNEYQHQIAQRFLAARDHTASHEN